MRTGTHPIVLLFLAAAVLHGENATGAGPAHRDGFRVLTSSAEGLDLELAQPPDDHTLAEAFLFAVPPGLHATAVITDLHLEPVFAPPPNLSPAAGTPKVEIIGPFPYRYQRICAVRVPLYVRSADGGGVRRLTRARIRIRFEGEAVASGAGIPDPLFEGVLRGALVNYDEGRTWRVLRTAVAPGAPAVTAPTRVDGPAILVGVAADGWTRITQRQLVQTGLNSSDIDPATYRLFRGMEELPLLVGPDSSISFLGVRHRKGSDEVEPLTDTTVYRLIWGMDAGRRFSLFPVDAPGATDTMDFAEAEELVEQNTGYFAGTTELEVIDNDPVPGEGWYWERVFPGQSVSLPVQLPHVATGAGGTAVVSVRLVSMTPDSPGVDHRARIVLNDSVIALREFDGRTVTTVTALVPLSHLRSGENTVAVASEPTSRPANLFAVDRISLTFARRLQASDNLLLFTAPPALPGSVQVFSAGGFSDSAITVVDPAAGRSIAPLGIAPDTSGGFTVLWRDTLTAPRRYCVVSAAGSIPPASLRKRDMGDVRTLPGGADCIIITHGLLRPAAERLAAHRRTTTGLRVAVVDIEDVYHTFSGGIPDPSAIREFLRSAYSSWQAPAPGAVLLFGDASWDPRRFLATTIRADFIPAYGFPAGDAWYGILDTTGIPLLQIGRIPAGDPVEAGVAVDKLIRYDGVRPGAWVKRFLFITGGTTPAEQTTYRTRSEALIRDQVAPDPVAGEALRAYKASDAVFDTGLRDTIRREIAAGLLFLNYLGHSTARSWGVDIGSPAALGNDGGRTPFVASVSCNIGAFAEPSGNVLAEDLLLAEDRGAIAVWSSSSLGYPTPGTQLVRAALSAMGEDSLRGLGELTSRALLALWQSDPADPIVRAMVRLNPLLGDPLTRLVLPTLPDPAIASGDLTIVPPAEGTTGARTVSLNARILNLGTSRGDTVAVRVDIAGGVADPQVITRTIRLPVRRADTLSLEWQTDAVASSWQVRVALDPEDRIIEADESNNVVEASSRINAP
jgi:ribosomal protein S28E/S33